MPHLHVYDKLCFCCACSYSKPPLHLSANFVLLGKLVRLGVSLAAEIGGRRKPRLPDSSSGSLFRAEKFQELKRRRGGWRGFPGIFLP